MDTLHPWKRMFYVGGDRSQPVILGKGGQLSATIAFAGYDMRTSPDHEVYNAACTRINILAEFARDEGFFIHDDLTTAPSEYIRAPWFMGRNDSAIETHNDRAAHMVRLLAEKRKDRHGRLVEPVIFETISHQPTAKELKWLKKLLFGSPKVHQVEGHIEEILSEFNEKVTNAIKLLSGRLGRAKRLDADHLYSYCYYTLTGVWLDLHAPKQSGSTFGRLMHVQREDDHLGNNFSVKAIDQQVHIRVVTPYGMPDQIRPEFFEDLCFLGAGFRWSTRITLVPASSVRKEYTQQWKRYNDSTMEWRQMMQARLRGDGQHDPVQLDLAKQAYKDVKETHGSAFGAYLVSSIIVYRDNERDAERQAKIIVDYLLGMHKPCDVEDVGAKIAMASTLPGNPQYEVSQDLLSDYPTVTSLPCSLPYTGPDERGGMTSVKQCVPWQFTIKDTFPGRVDFGNGQNRHVAITAPVRMGKSTLLEVIIAAMLAAMENPFIYLLDVDVDKSASRIACNAMGGKVLSFKNRTAAIQPFRNIEDTERRRTATRWIKQCIRAHGLDDRNPAIHRRIDEAMDLMATIDPDLRTVAQFQAIVQDVSVKQCLNVFACGEFSDHVGGNKNVIGEPPYVVIDCTGLTKGDPLAACVVSALVDEITFTVGNHGGPVQLCIDEAVQVFPLIGESIDAAYKRWPKQGGGITIVVHDPRDLDEIGVTGKIIIQNTGAWVCLGDAKAADNEAYTRNLQLTEFQRAMISEMKQGDFMVKVGGDVRVLQTDLSRLERWVLGQGGKEAAELAAKLDLTARTTDEFGIQLLKEGGFHDEARWIEDCVGSNVIRLGIAAE